MTGFVGIGVVGSKARLEGLHCVVVVFVEGEMKRMLIFRGYAVFWGKKLS